MRKIYKDYRLGMSLVLLAMALFAGAGGAYAQACTNISAGATCTRANFYYGEILPNSGCGTFTENSLYGPGYYFRVPVLQGGCYTVSTCGAPINTQIGAFQGSATTSPFASDDDNGPDCAGTNASIVMVPTFTDYANVDVREVNCLLGGTASITVKLRQNNNLSFTSSSSDMCQGQVRALTATPAPVTASPQPNSGDVGTFSGTGVVGTNFTGPTPPGNSASHTLTYNFGYCSTTQSINVFRNPTTASAGSNQTICTASTNISANSPVYGTGTWSVVSGTGTITTPSAAATTVTGIPAGTSVTLRWSIANGPCTPSTSDIVITRVNAPTPSNAGPNQIICSTSATMAGNAPAVGTGAWTLLSGSGTIVTSTNPTTTINNLGLGANSFIWTISNGNCPVSTDTVVITRSNQPTASQAGPNQLLCDSSTVMAANGPVVGTGSWAIVSGTGNIASASSPNSALNNIGVGTTVLTWTISNGTCTASVDTVTVTRNAAPAAPTVTGVQNVCPGNSTVLTASSGASSPNYTWWNAPVGGGALAATGQYNTPVLNAPATYYVQVTDGSSGCTSARTAVTVNINPLPVPSLGADTSICVGDTLCLNPGAFNSYLWSNGGGGNTQCLFGNGSMWVLVTDNNGCQAFDTITVTTIPSPSVSLGPDQSFCPNGSANIGVPPVAGISYLWSTGSTSSQITVNTAATFTLSVTNQQGCTGSDQITTTFQPTPVAAFVPDTSNCPNVIFFNQSSNSTSWDWDFDDGGTSTVQNPTHNYQSAGGGTYNVRLISTGPCGSDTLFIPVLISCLVGVENPHTVDVLLFPNPNNGSFKLRLAGLEEAATLRIFDLGGHQVFQRTYDGIGGSLEENVHVDAAAGLYFMKLQVGEQTIVRRFVIE